MPLAIELAAARTTMLPAEALLAQISDRLRLLQGGARDAPARQQTMRQAIAWSYDLLTADQQVLFRRLAVFAAGFTAGAAESVAGVLADGEEDVLITLGALVDASLVTMQPVAAEPRFAMFGTIREFALERLRESGDEEMIRERHARWSLRLTATPEPTIEAASDRAFLERLMTEHENLRAALRWFWARSATRTRS